MGPADLGGLARVVEVVVKVDARVTAERDLQRHHRAVEHRKALDLQGAVIRGGEGAKQERTVRASGRVVVWSCGLWLWLWLWLWEGSQD